MAARRAPTIRDWNVVVTARESGFVYTCELLEQLGPIKRTAYYNVLVMKVDDVDRFLATLDEWVAKDPAILTYLGRVVPAQHTFNFDDAQDFETKAREYALGWVSALAGKTFHVRMHRRGFKGRLTAQQEERFLDQVLLAALEQAGAPGLVSFEDPDAIICVETIDARAGMSLWSREDLARYPFLGLD